MTIDDIPKEETKSEVRKFRPNYQFLSLVIIMLLCMVVHTTYVVSATYRLYAFMEVNFDWPKDMLATYDSIFGQASLPGGAIGAIITGRLLSRGRRICLLLCTLLAALGIGLQLVEDMWVILLGRVVTGFSAGFLGGAQSRILEEFTPTHLYGLVMTIFFFL